MSREVLQAVQLILPSKNQRNKAKQTLGPRNRFLSAASPLGEGCAACSLRLLSGPGLCSLHIKRVMLLTASCLRPLFWLDRSALQKSGAFFGVWNDTVMVSGEVRNVFQGELVSSDSLLTHLLAGFWFSGCVDQPSDSC